jgi:hypothetical protein
VQESGKKREIREFNGKKYLMETALKGDVAILRAWKADEAGNCVFRYTTKAFGVLMAKAASLTIVEAENIVPVGSIHPDEVHLPGIYVDRVVPATAEKTIELLKLREEEGDKDETLAKPQNEAQVRRNRIGKRAAKELKDGYYVNLGVGKMTWICGSQMVKEKLLTLAKASRRWPQLSCPLAARSGFSLRTVSWEWVLTPLRRRLMRKSYPRLGPRKFLTWIYPAILSMLARKPLHWFPVLPPLTLPSHSL